MQFTLTIRMDDLRSPDEEENGADVADVLREVAGKLSRSLKSQDASSVRTAHGKSVGAWKVTR